ncbi:disks large-associated protein 1 isoform X1 [Notolabrus celidotus]|uniref:disks large-associated protein 1 isoform X1 n=1 Tax=Notolabrus celidotus TaxID=1203425 RepID=UPI00148FB741|nr:disks large-associated protein 1 isoform X1 [Notolabrus celidotus]XP_034562946.1 disks large-associated protein 1 isoform X1 [Notolabrus celidotus]
MTMKGLSSSRSHHHAVTCDPSYDSMTLGHSDRRSYFLNPGEAHSGDHSCYTQRPNSFQSECSAYPDLASCTFPRRHYSSHHELKDECSAVVPYTGPTGISKGGGGGGNNNNHIPSNLLEQFERQAPVRREGYHTLQYKRTAVEHQRSDSPGRIRHLVHSVQKLFTKSHSLEGPSGSAGGGSGRMNGSKSSPDDPPSSSGTLKHSKRSKSKDRSKSEPKMRSAISGYWSSDDTLDREMCLYHHHHGGSSGGLPTGVMTMGRHPDKSQSQYFMESYNTISAHSLKTSRSNNDVKCSTCSGGSTGAMQLVPLDGQMQLKKSSWSSTLTVSRAREVYQKASVNLDKALVKAEQGRTCHFLQVPQDDWNSFSPLGKDDEIPCRRMRSGSYIKAMAEDDSGDSDCSPKPSPKVQARRASYLKATQPSLTEMTTLQISTEHSPKLQIRSHSYLRAVSEVSINRSLDSLDPAGLLASPKFRSRNESYMRAMSTISQVSEVEVNGQIEAVCESVFSEMESQAVDALDLPMPGCFRMRSHSYVRAIEKGCSQEEEEAGVTVGKRRTHSPPRTATTVRTIQSSTVSSCITTYKKTPPPVPPRTTPSKPFISITAQSSTESAQDAYMDGGSGQRTGMSSQPGLSNSTESIDSMKALTAAIEAANAQVHGPASQHVTNSTITITATATTSAVAHVSADSKAQREALRKCLSIGIQVDPDEGGPTVEQSKFQSIGIQVEDERCYRRMTRSNSVTTAVQADLDDPSEAPAPLPRYCATMPRQHSRDAATSTVSIQGSGNHYHACAADDYGEVGFDPSILPPPDPWMDSVAEPDVDTLMDAIAPSVCPRDGRWFLKLLQAETERMDGWCRQMEHDELEVELPDEVLGKIRSAVGSAQLLMSQKFQQFRELCEENLNPNAHPRPVSQDLAGFWDMLQLSIENISLKFDELHQLKANNWKPLTPPEIQERRMPPPVPKKPQKGHPPLARDRSLESSERQRLEARKRLLAAKRAASVRQSSATESADSIEIYIPEAQTRL